MKSFPPVFPFSAEGLYDKLNREATLRKSCDWFTCCSNSNLLPKSLSGQRIHTQPQRKVFLFIYIYTLPHFFWNGHHSLSLTDSWNVTITGWLWRARSTDLVWHNSQHSVLLWYANNPAPCWHVVSPCQAGKAHFPCSADCVCSQSSSIHEFWQIVWPLTIWTWNTFRFN